ncbi:hypothetical protein BLOT_016080 [Blomia tropicalis]|nr:hypothetical protein BLOT_016080 [Blomia tropicalis]
MNVVIENFHRINSYNKANKVAKRLLSLVHSSVSLNITNKRLIITLENIENFKISWFDCSRDLPYYSLGLILSYFICRNWGTFVNSTKKGYKDYLRLLDSNRHIFANKLYTLNPFEIHEENEEEVVEDVEVQQEINRDDLRPEID